MIRWSYSLPLGAYPTNIWVTTDNFINMTLSALTAKHESTTRTINLTLNNIAVSTAVCSHHVTGGTNGGLDESPMVVPAPGAST